MTELEYIARWGAAFALTVAVEVPTAARLLAPAGAPPGRRAGVATLAQFVTHPIVWFVIPAFQLPRPAYLVVAEGWAFLAEAAAYRLVFPSLPLRRAALASLVANAASVAVGHAVREWVGFV